jgi:hypothetical protein
MNVSELISRKNIREAISEAQLDFGLAETEEDFVHLAFIHLGPDSSLAMIRRALVIIEDNMGDE